MAAPIKTVCLVVVLTMAVTAQGEEVAENDLHPSFQELVKSLTDAEAALRSQPAFASELEQVGGYRHLVRAFIKGLEAEVLQDADYPYFRILDFWLREGGDNPDQRYAFSPVRGGEAYRIWGRLGSAARVELQLYAGRPWDGTGKSVGYLNFEDIALSEQGDFEVWLTPDRREGNWLRNPTEATTVFARHIYSDWSDAEPGEVHIDRVGYEGRRRPEETAAELSARLVAAREMFKATALNWPQFVQARYLNARPPNTVIAPIDTYRFGGARGRWLASGHFDLEEDEVLVIRMPQTAAAYQALQLTDLWYASLESANRVSSLTSQQSLLAPDGDYYYVIANEDPGYANWLDAGALTRGIYILRWDGVQDTLPQTQHATATLMTRDELSSAIPGFSEVSEASRRATRAARRQHMQRRANR